VSYWWLTRTYLSPQHELWPGKLTDIQRPGRHSSWGSVLQSRQCRCSSRRLPVAGDVGRRPSKHFHLCSICRGPRIHCTARVDERFNGGGSASIRNRSVLDERERAGRRAVSPQPPKRCSPRRRRNAAGFQRARSAPVGEHSSFRTRHQRIGSKTRFREARGAVHRHLSAPSGLHVQVADGLHGQLAKDMAR
jgi:hypothetical protein